MGKGDRTRAAIIAEALAVASLRGLEGLSIGDLARRTRLSKSGLFAHFGSKEALQRAVLEAASEDFTYRVLKPALAQPRGLPRLRAVFENWLSWHQAAEFPGGCPLMAAAFELDDKPGPLRDYLANQHALWLESLAHLAVSAAAAGHLDAHLEPEQFAYELNNIVLGYCFSSRLLRDLQAEQHARAAFERLIQHATP